MVKNLPASAGDMGSSPCQGRFPHAAEQLSPCATTTEARMPELLKPMRLEPVLHNKRSHRNEKPTHWNEELLPLTATRESPRAATETQRGHK